MKSKIILQDLTFVPIYQANVTVLSCFRLTLLPNQRFMMCVLLSVRYLTKRYSSLFVAICQQIKCFKNWQVAYTFRKIQDTNLRIYDYLIVRIWTIRYSRINSTTHIDL